MFGVKSWVTRALVGVGVSAPAFCQPTPVEMNASQHWDQIQMPAPSRGGGGTATVSKRSGPGDYFRIDLTVNGGSSASGIAAVMIDTEATYFPVAGSGITSFDYSESSINFGMGTQLAGPALRQNGKIYVLWNLIPSGANSWTPNQRLGITAAELAELHTDGRWLEYSSRPDFSAAGRIIEFGFWRASEVPASNGGSTSNCGMYMCGPSTTPPTMMTTSYGVQGWSITVSTSLGMAMALIAATVAATEAALMKEGNPGANSDDPTDPVFPATGEYYESSGELSLGGPLPLTFTRYYAALLQSNGITGALGANWTHTFEVSIAQDSTQATVRLFRGKRIRFTKTAAGTWQAAGTAYPYQLITASGALRFLDPEENLIYSFDGNGALTRIEDRNGNALTVTRSINSPGPDRVADGLGRSLSFTYAGTKLTRVEDQRGRAITFTYTGENLTAVTGANGKTTRYTYAGGALLASRTLPTGDTPITQSFDARGRVVRQTDGLGYSATLSYDTPRTGATTIANPLNATFQYAYQGRANLVSQIDPAGQGASFTYDSSNRLVQITDRAGGKKIIAYDPLSGLPATRTDTLGNVTQVLVRHTDSDRLHILQSDESYCAGWKGS